MAESTWERPTGPGPESGERHDGSGAEGKPFFPHHVVDRTILVLLAVAIMISLATFYPAAMEEQADPFLAPKDLRPAWYFLPIFQVLRMADRLGWAPGSRVPGLLGVYGVAAGFVIIVTWPWIARVRRGPARMALRLVEAAAVMGLLGLTLWGWRS